MRLQRALQVGGGGGGGKGPYASPELTFGVVDLVRSLSLYSLALCISVSLSLWLSLSLSLSLSEYRVHSAQYCVTVLSTQ